MVVIRRELPRTSVAGPAVKVCRIEADEDSPLPWATPAADRLCLDRVHENFADCAASGSLTERARVSALDFTADRPDKA